MKKMYDKNIGFDDECFEDLDDLSFEDLDFNDEEIYDELTETDDFVNLENLEDKGTCVECGDPNGYLSIDPYSNLYEEGINIYLCRHCSDNHLYS